MDDATAVKLLKEHYFGEKDVISAIPYGGGHINDTYLVTKQELGASTHYIFQRINNYVFKKPEEVMRNLEKISDFMRGKVAKRGGDVMREVVNIICTKDGESFFLDEQGGCWRLTVFIGDTETYEVVDSPEIFRQCGQAFGEFQHMLSDFPADTLYETIPGFHNTPARCQQFEQAVRDDLSHRLDTVQDEVTFLRARYDGCRKLTDLLNAGKLPLRVTHNDTKLSNILFDRQTKKPVCVLDLDTVMPGLTAYDFGDAIRGGAGTAAEDEPDVNKSGVNLALFDSFTDGFLTATGSALTPREIETLPDGAWLMTIEGGMRFLADYLNGDIYFKTAYPTHNLVRARNMFKMVTDMEQHRPELDAIIARYRK